MIKKQKNKEGINEAYSLNINYLKHSIFKYTSQFYYLVKATKLKLLFLFVLKLFSFIQSFKHIIHLKRNRPFKGNNRIKVERKKTVNTLDYKLPNVCFSFFIVNFLFLFLIALFSVSLLVYLCF
jgi:hypothetical protein